MIFDFSITCWQVIGLWQPSLRPVFGNKLSILIGTFSTTWLQCSPHRIHFSHWLKRVSILSSHNCKQLLSLSEHLSKHIGRTPSFNSLAFSSVKLMVCVFCKNTGTLYMLFSFIGGRKKKHLRLTSGEDEATVRTMQNEWGRVSDLPRR